MANLQDIKAKFQGFVDIEPGLQTFVFDDLSQINRTSIKKYKVLLLKPPASNIPLPNSELEYQHYSLEFFVLDLFKKQAKKQAKKTKGAGKTLEQVWDECVDEIRKVILRMSKLQPEFVLVGAAPIERGHRLHNSDIVGASVTVVWRVHDCVPDLAT